MNPQADDGAAAIPGTVAVAAGRHAANEIERGRDIYNLRCYFCHGYSGDAKTVAASYLAPPPRDFTQTDPAVLTESDMIRVVRDGKAGTAMMAFQNVLSADDVTAVVRFVRAEFMHGGARNTRYHTADNGWPDHERKYGQAFPFATGALDYRVADDQLDQSARAGKRLFMSACITCHERAADKHATLTLNNKSVSYPRGDFVPGQHQQVDAVTSASPYSKHDVKPALAAADDDLTRRGETLYQANCAFCHAADGTGKNWIGSFLQPHPRDLTAPELHRRLSEAQLADVIAGGLPGTTMPAWRDVLAQDEIRAVAHYVRRILGHTQ